MPASKEVMAQVAKLLEQGKFGEHLTSSIGHQKTYIARLHSMTPPCWSCGEPVSYYEAVGDDYDPEVYRGAEEKYTCPHCNTTMIHVVPFFAAPNPWYWGNPKLFREKKHEPAQAAKGV